MRVTVNSYRRLVIFGIVLHVLVAVAVWWHLQQYEGVLPASDESYNLGNADRLVTEWRQGRAPNWDEITTSETNPGYYYLLAGARWAGIEHLLGLRLINVLAGLAAIWLWRRAMLANGEPPAAARWFAVAALLIPSLALWSTLLLKEAVVYALVAAHVLVLARVIAASRVSARDIVFYAATLLALSYFRNYASLLLLGLSAVIIARAKGPAIALAFAACAVVTLLLFNPYVLMLVGYKLWGEAVRIRFFDWIAGNAELITGGPKSGSFGPPIAVTNRETGIGGSAIAPGVPLWEKLWLFLSFPLPWQAKSALQRLASPEVALFLLALPVAIAGVIVKLRQRDLFAIYVAALSVAVAAMYIVMINNLGTLYRIKSSLMFAYVYFAAIGAHAISLRLRGART